MHKNKFPVFTVCAGITAALSYTFEPSSLKWPCLAVMAITGIFLIADKLNDLNNNN
jgi:hypothetical protein